MKIRLGALRRMVNEVASQRLTEAPRKKVPGPVSPEEFAKKLMTSYAIEAGYAGRTPPKCAELAADYALDTSVSVAQSDQLGSAYMDRLRAALVALAMKEYTSADE